MQNDVTTSAFLALRFQLRKAASAILKSDEEADDALQDLFLKTWKKSPERVENNKAFLFSTLKNICIDILRRRKLTYEKSENQDTAYEQSHFEDSDSIKFVHGIIQKHLSGLQRQVFELYVFEELDYDEIALKLNITVEAARTNMSRARRIIRIYCKDISRQ